MRLASAFGIVALALTATACRTTAGPPYGDKVLAAKLVGLGIEGKTYSTDLGQVDSIHLKRVYPAGADFLIEDIHGHLTYIDGATLNPAWEYYGLDKPFDKDPDFTPSAIVGIAGGKLVVISRLNGVPEVEPRWVDVVPSAGMVATDQTMYVPTYPTPAGNKTILSIGLASGYHGWGWRCESDVVSNLVKGGPGAGDSFYFVTADGDLYGFPTHPATERGADPGWTRNLYTGVREHLVLEGNDIAVVASDGRLILVDRVTGTPRWEAYPNKGEKAQGSAQFSSGHVFYMCGGELRAFVRETGAPAWASREVTGFVAERGDRMLMQAGANNVVAVDKKTGEVLARASVPGWHFPVRVAPDSTVYAISNEGMLLAVEFGL
jgi:hypothetical protein